MHHGTDLERRSPVAVLGVLAVLMLLAGCDRIVLRWQQPSPAFIAGDIDLDGQISREEWESVYGTNALTRAVLEFDWGDCDRNGRLTWEEYFHVRIRRQRCQSSSLETLVRQGGGATLHEEVLTPIVSAKDIYLARVSLMRNRQRLITAKFHDDYSEQDKLPGGLYLYTLSCGDIEQLEIPRDLPGLQAVQSSRNAAGRAASRDPLHRDQSQPPHVHLSAVASDHGAGGRPCRNVPRQGVVDSAAGVTGSVDLPRSRTPCHRRIHADCAGETGVRRLFEWSPMGV